MFRFTIEALPSDEIAKAENFTGASIDAWIDFKDPWAAELIAKLYIKENGWLPGETTEAHEVGADDYKEDAKGLEHFQNAETDGAAFAYRVFRGEEQSDADEAQ